MKQVLVIYHREDNDGACSAGIISAFLTRHKVAGLPILKQNEIEFYGVSYVDLNKDWDEFLATKIKDNPPVKKPKITKWDKYQLIFMVDISFNRIEAMNYMYNHFGDRFIWCDHHAPIIEASKENPVGNSLGIRRTDQSALLNTWDWMVKASGLQHIEPSPYLTKLSDYDSWAHTWKPEYKKEEDQEKLFAFNTGVTRTSNLSPKWFALWVGYWLDDCERSHFNIAEDADKLGTLVYNLDKERISRAITTHGDTNWSVYVPDFCRRACAIITTERINSRNFACFRGTDVVNGIVFKVDAASDTVTMSLYNVNDDDVFHCGEFLKAHYNGGGHQGAAGCTLTREQFIKVFSAKSI